MHEQTTYMESPKGRQVRKGVDAILGKNPPTEVQRAAVIHIISTMAEQEHITPQACADIIFLLQTETIKSK